ncbi:MAG TPA: LPS export ABC transporter periplasmic protein LptC [Burkholderiales bacterium]|nr:LPS export ABC transporter periplasmic protein LptC [Burkholderiales bacterium]
MSTTRLFPLALMLALALLTLWLDHQVSVEGGAHPSMRRHDPDYLVTNFTTTTYNRDGKAETVLSAAEMQHYPDDDSTAVSAPRVLQAKPAQPRFTVEADRGNISREGDEIFLYDNVVLVREADAVQPRARMTTSFLHILRDRSLVRTDRQVLFEEEGRSLSGRGMEYHADTSELFLRDDVRGRFEPRTEPRIEPKKAR